MIRLFASDMDGTLLNDKGYISDRNDQCGEKNCRNMEFILL